MTWHKQTNNVVLAAARPWGSLERAAVWRRLFGNLGSLGSLEEGRMEKRHGRD